MSSNHTANYNLSQWVKSDKVLMEDFNADNAKIDAALAGKASASALSSLQSTVSQHTAALAGKGNCQLYATSYTGTSGETKTFSFPQKPAVVFVFNEDARLFLFAGMDYAWYETRSSNAGVLVSWSGNSVTLSSGYDTNRMDVAGRTYHVIAFLYA